jgi:hypothetical protein
MKPETNMNTVKKNERGHLCCILQGEGLIQGYDIVNYYQENRYYPGLTGAVVLGENHILLVLEGPTKLVIQKFMELTESHKAFIQIISTGPFINDERLFNSFDFGLRIETSEGKKLVTEHNQEEISSLKKIMNEKTNGNPLRKFIRTFLSKGHVNINEFRKES